MLCLLHQSSRVALFEAILWATGQCIHESFVALAPLKSYTAIKLFPVFAYKI